MKPSERILGWSDQESRDEEQLKVLDELWERVFPPDGSVLSGHSEDGAPIYTMGGSSTEPAKGDAVEMLRGLANGRHFNSGADCADIGRIIAAIEAERASAYRARTEQYPMGIAWELRNALATADECRKEWDAWRDACKKAEEPLTAEQRAHEETWQEANRAGKEEASLRAQLTEQSATIAGLESDRDQCAQVLEQVNAVAEGLRARIDRAAELARDRAKWARQSIDCLSGEIKRGVSLRQSLDSKQARVDVLQVEVEALDTILAALTSPHDTAGKVAKEGEIPGVEWLDGVSRQRAVVKDTDGDSVQLRAFQGELSPLSVGVDEAGQTARAHLTRDQVRLTLIPLLERFVRTGKLRGAK